jgi:hypothetical protein
VNKRTNRIGQKSLLENIGNTCYESQRQITTQVTQQYGFTQRFYSSMSSLNPEHQLLGESIKENGEARCLF